MNELIKENKPKAQKDYNCDASAFLDGSGLLRNSGYFSFAEMREIAKAKKQNFKIKKGNYYINQRLKYDGDLITFRAIPEIHNICIKHDLYRE